ncbi:sterol carrier protein domain-containing protein [Jatrophihabitans lederbergiae]|uniref:sterol carrier protein domain-containing protein n=1 Tax=Jatrophihabitans lederbergiae TaxID=3075547 RepID=UPI0037C14F90
MQALGSLYLGGMSAANLAAAGRMHACDPAHVAPLSRIFRGRSGAAELLRVLKRTLLHTGASDAS